jgi:hypothetical protein
MSVASGLVSVGILTTMLWLTGDSEMTIETK